MMNWGRVALGTVIPFMFTTYDGATGASEEGSGLAVTDIEIYKAGGGLTQRSSDAGYALLDADGHALDSIVGLAGFSVDTGDNTDAGFFVAGGYYIVVVSSVTVDTQTVNFIAGTFSLGPTLSVAGVEEVDVTHWLGTAAATPTVNGVPEVDITHLGGTAIGSTQIRANVVQVEGTDATDYYATLDDAIMAVLGALADAAADGDPTTTDTFIGYIKQIVNVLVGSAGVVTFPAAAAPGNAVSLAEVLRAIYDDTNDIQPKIGTPVTDLAADIAVIEAQTDDIGVAGAGLSAVPWNAAWDAEVESEVTDALNAYDPPTRAELTSDINSILLRLRGIVLHQGTVGDTGNDTTHVHLNGLTYGNDEIVGYYLVIYDVSELEHHVREIDDWVLATELATVATLPFTPANDTDLFWLIALQAAAGGSAPTAAEVADAVWDEDATGHQTQGSFGQAIGDPAADTNTIFKAVVTDAAGATVGLDVVDVEGKVDDLESRLGTPSDLGSGATVAANLVDIEGQTDDIGVAGAGLTAIPDSAGVTTLLSRLTALRAGYLDNLSAGAVATAAKLLSYFQSALRKDVTVDADIGGNYDDATDSQEAIRDRGDAAWATATGFATTSHVQEVEDKVDIIDTNVDSILADTGTDGVVVAAASKTGYRLSATGVQDIWDALTSALTTAGSIGKLLVDNINATISSRATPAQVNTEVLDVLNVDTFAEPGQGAPAATASLVTKIGFVYKAWRNRSTQTSSEYSLYADDATTKDQEATFSDNGTTADRGEIGTGA